jgi:hypothetical protein
VGTALALPATVTPTHSPLDYLVQVADWLLLLLLLLLLRWVCS